MTTAEKLRATEALWADLTRDQRQIELPVWHGEVLRDRMDAVKNGSEFFVDWETAKKQLRDRLS